MGAVFDHGCFCVFLKVLNAFRHQRWVQILPRCLAPYVRCAQRLSASEMGAAELSNAGVGVNECSTPFGIRDGCSRQATNREHVIMCSTPFGIRDGCRAELSNAGVGVNECSTPFGIRDGCSGWAVSPPIRI